ncbi:restriction endonuclease subunit S [Paenibacillus filicis]|uniref:Restriction endonuclease subunit S n=1 Tax=Paenibacillus gyeongsangnamensis TaxID=3388067 RepID=A0ABT4QDU4_9BACL|nr:restriction endonuclease subunit S [Paenibacillus filicis]MCZ8514957.1 restriction endonuclease subunit S [Paenibacillus filicis]
MPKYRFEDIAFNITQKRKPTSDDMKTYIGLEHLDSGSLSVTRWGSNVPIKGDKLLMQKGDVLFGKRNAYLRRAAIAPHDGLFSAHGMILRPNEKVISRKLFPFFICSDYFFDAAIRISVGSLSPTINWSALKELEFKLPDINEQEKLAELLWAANNTKEAYKKLLYLTDELVKSQFIEMFKNGNYPTVRASEVCNFITKGTTPPTNEIKTRPEQDSIPYLKVYNLSFDGRLLFHEEPQYISRQIHEGKLARSIVYPNDVLMNIVGPPLGKFALVEDEYPEWNINQAIAIFRAKEQVLPKFLLQALMQPDVLQPFLEKAVGIRQLNLSLEQCRDLEFPLPPLEHQQRFVEFAQQTDKSKFELKQNIDNLETTIKALMVENFG